MISAPMLIAAICIAESGNDESAIGDGGEAVGAYGQHEIFVRECNRLAGYERWSYEDRKDRAKAQEMMRLFFKNHVCPKVLGRPPTIYDFAYAYHSGPDAIHNPSDQDKGYAAKVKSIYDRISADNDYD